MIPVYDYGQFITILLAVAVLGGIVGGVCVYMYMKETIKVKNTTINKLRKDITKMAYAKSSKMVKEMNEELFSLISIIADMNRNTESPRTVLGVAIDIARKCIRLVGAKSER